MAHRRLWSFQKGVLWVLDFSAPDRAGISFAEPILPRIGARFEETDESNAEAMAQAMGLSNPGQIMRRWSLNRRSFAARVEGGIAAYGWVSRGAECVGEMGRQIYLKPDEAYVWDCYTLPAYRRRRLYSALLSHMNTTLADEGIRRIWIGSNLENRPSLRGFVNVGYRPAAQMTHFRIGDLNCLWVSNYRDSPAYFTAAAREAFSVETDRNVGPLVIGWVKPEKLSACSELED